MTWQNGAEFASPLATMETQLQVPFSSLVPEVRRRWLVIRIAATVSFFCAAVLLLWMSGYPRPRVAVAAALFAAFAAVMPRVWWVLTSLPSSAAREGIIWSQLIGALITLGLFIDTGGMYSPFLVGHVVGVVTASSAFGWTRYVSGIVALQAVGLVSLTFASDRLVGPMVPGTTYKLLTAGAMVFTAVIHISLIAVRKQAYEASEAALGRARELIFTQLCQRTRDMEKVGASLSHELKNPLQAIMILVQLSAREAQDPRARERLHVAETELERMQALIKDYLSFSRPFEKLQRHPVNLASLTDQVVEVLRERADACGVSVERKGDARVEADARRVSEALHNLVSNAIDATPRGGRIAIEIAEQHGVARIAVRDSGEGMSPETLAKLGTPFFTTREDGTGLGVALARAAFVQHGGSLDYESEPGNGTTAKAILPVKSMGRRADGPDPRC